MTTHRDLPEEDYLKKLMQHVPLENPSDDFVDRVMHAIQSVPQRQKAGNPVFVFLRSYVPYAALIFILLVVVGTSDLPFLNWLPGKVYYLDNFVPYFNIFITTLRNLFSSSYVSFGLLIGFSGCLLFLADTLLSSRFSRRKSQNTV